MYINKNNIVTNIRGIDMIMNLDNQAVVGVNKKGIKFYKKLVTGGSLDNDLKDPELKELYQFLTDNDFISKREYNKKTEKLLSAYVHLTNKCNLHCVGCYSLDSKRNCEPDLPYEVLCKTIKELADEGVVNLIFSGGEPFFRKDIVELVRYAKVTCNIEHVVVITNGTVDRSEVFDGLKGVVDTVSVSLDTYSPECPSYIRDEGIHDKVIKTVKELKKHGIPVAILPTLHHANAEVMVKYLELSKELNVGISYSILSTCETEEFRDFLLSESDLQMISEHFLTYGLTANDTPINNTLEGKNYCGACKNMLSVGTDGKVYPCHMLMVPELCLGDVNDYSIKEIRQNSPIAKKFTEFNVDNFNQCSECTYKYLCGGGCRARAFMIKKNLLEKDPFCILYKNYYSHLFEGICNQVGISAKEDKITVS